MALIECGECKRETSDKAEACPGCGNPLSANEGPKKYFDDHGRPREAYDWELEKEGFSPNKRYNNKPVMIAVAFAAVVSLVVFSGEWFDGDTSASSPAARPKNIESEEQRLERIVAQIEDRIAESRFNGVHGHLSLVTDQTIKSELEVRITELIESEINNHTREDLSHLQELLRQMTLFRPDDDLIKKKLANTKKMTERGNWEGFESVNSLDDSSLVHRLLTATKGRAEQGRASLPELSIRCKSNTTEAYINFDTFLGWDTSYGTGNLSRITYRFDDDKAVSESWQNSTNNESLFAKSAIPFARRLATAERLIVRVIPYGENPVETVFHTKGSWAAVNSVAKTCNWTLADPP